MNEAKALKLAIRLVPALLSTIGGIAKATKKKSDGGKKITKQEAQDIWRKLLGKLKPIVAEELETDLD